LKFYILNIIFLLSVNFALSQKQDSSITGVDSLTLEDITIGKIFIAGNDVTDEDIIMRELSVRENSKLNIKMLEYDVQRL